MSAHHSAEHRNTQLASHLFGKKLGTVHPPPDAACPVHGNRNDAVRIEEADLAGSMQGQKLANRPRQQLAAGMLHGENGIAQRATIDPQCEGRVEAESGPGAFGARHPGAAGRTRIRTLRTEAFAGLKQALLAGIAEEDGTGGMQIDIAAGASRRKEQILGPTLETAEDFGRTTQPISHRSIPPQRDLDLAGIGQGRQRLRSEPRPARKAERASHCFERQDLLQGFGGIGPRDPGMANQGGAWLVVGVTGGGGRPWMAMG